MSRVSDGMIESAWQQVSEAGASPKRLSELMDRFGGLEPAVFDFVSEASVHWSEDASDLAFHAALVIWLSFSESDVQTNRSSTAVSADSLIRHFEKNSEWLDQQQGDAILIQKKLSDFSRFSEPELMRYVVELVFEAHEDGLELEPEEQQELLLVLKSVVDSFAE